VLLIHLFRQSFVGPKLTSTIGFNRDSLFYPLFSHSCQMSFVNVANHRKAKVIPTEPPTSLHLIFYCRFVLVLLFISEAINRKTVVIISIFFKRTEFTSKTHWYSSARFKEHIQFGMLAVFAWRKGLPVNNRSHLLVTALEIMHFPLSLVVKRL